MNSSDSEEIVVLSDSDEDEAPAAPPQPKETPSRTSPTPPKNKPSPNDHQTDLVEVLLSSSDSDSDVIVEDTIDNSGVEFLARYDKRSDISHRRNKRKRSVNNIQNGLDESRVSGRSDATASDTSLVDKNLKNELITPSKIKSSPQSLAKSPSSSQLANKITSLDERLSSVSINDDNNGIPVDPEFLEDAPIEESATEVSFSVNSEQIEGVLDNNSERQSPSKEITPSLNQLTLSSPLSSPSHSVSENSITSIQTESEDSLSDQNVVNKVLDEPTDRIERGEYYVCSFGCGQEFNNALLFYKHEKKHENEMIEKNIKRYKCREDDCGFVALTQSELMYHNAEHQGLYLCRDLDCKYQAPHALILNEHMKKCRKRKNQRTNKKSKLDCHCGEFSCRPRY